MSETWNFKCLKCEQESEERLNKGDNVLLNTLKNVDAIKSLLDEDDLGYIEVSIMSMGTEPISFLMEHYGDEHDVVVYSEYGKIRRVEK